ncbi:MAG: hypothetical protein KDA17_07690, partial [Candidatus Saccharibacteria bacterium]|nr:hypothetical protein [Candidatus Saccharibacteria bacterium]
GEDFSKVPVYPTLRNAFKAGVDLIKYSATGKWLKIDKAETAEMYPNFTAAGPEQPEVDELAVAQAAEEAAFEAEQDAAEAKKAAKKAGKPVVEAAKTEEVDA